MLSGTGGFRDADDEEEYTLIAPDPCVVGVANGVRRELFEVGGGGGGGCFIFVELFHLPMLLEEIGFFGVKSITNFFGVVVVIFLWGCGVWRPRRVHQRSPLPTVGCGS